MEFHKSKPVVFSLNCVYAERERDTDVNAIIYKFYNNYIHAINYQFLFHEKISNLFARDELDEITQALIPVMKKELPRHPPTFDNLYEYFLSRAKKNLHVVLCFSPVSFFLRICFPLFH